MKIAGRLVGENDLRIRDDRARDAHELLLAAGELIGIEVFFSDDLESIQDVGHHALAILAADISVRERNLEVLVHRQVVEQVITLKHEADVLLVKFRTLLRIQPMHRLVHEVVLTRPRAVVHAEDVEERRLAGAGRPHDRDEFAFLDVDVHAAEHVGPADTVRI